MKTALSEEGQKVRSELVIELIGKKHAYSLIHHAEMVECLKLTLASLGGMVRFIESEMGEEGQMRQSRVYPTAVIADLYARLADPISNLRELIKKVDHERTD